MIGWLEDSINTVSGVVCVSVGISRVASKVDSMVSIDTGVDFIPI